MKNGRTSRRRYYMTSGVKRNVLLIAFLGLLMLIPGRPAMAAANKLNDNYVVDLRAGSLLLDKSAQSEAVYDTFAAMDNNGVVAHDPDNWGDGVFDLDQNGTRDLVIAYGSEGGVVFSVHPDSSVKGKITLTVNSDTLSALMEDGLDYYKSLTFCFPDSLPVSISGTSVSGIVDKEYTGSALTQSITVQLSDLVLQNGTNYTVTYKNNTNVGTATVTITGKGTCTGSITKTFAITKKSVDSAAGTINALKAAAVLTTADKSAVEAARAAYDKLNEAQRKLIPAATLQKLTEAEAKIAALEKAAAETASKEKTAEKKKKTVVKGKVYKVGTLKCKVTNAAMNGKGTVTLTGTTAKKAKLTKLTIPATVKIRGASFRVIKVPKKKLAKYKKLFSTKTGFKKTMKIK